MASLHPLLSLAAAGAGIALAAVVVTDTLGGGSEAAPGAERATDTAATSKGRDAAEDEAIRRALAGLRVQAPAEPAQPAPRAEAEAPPHGLALTGVAYFANGDAKNRAVIVASGRAGSYPTGTKLPGGAHLLRIDRDAAVIHWHGREEVLALAGAGPGKAPAEAPKTFVLSPVRIAQALSEPTFIERFSIFRRTARSGEEGMVVRENGSGAYLLAAGLRDNDIVLSVNDIPLDSPMKVGPALEDAARAGHASLRIERQGVLQTLDIRLPIL